MEFEISLDELKRSMYDFRNNDKTMDKQITCFYRISPLSKYMRSVVEISGCKRGHCTSNAQPPPYGHSCPAKIWHFSRFPKNTTYVVLLGIGYLGNRCGIFRDFVFELF